MGIVSFLKLAIGLYVLGFLWHGWRTGQEWVVLTIFPMMAAPYIVGAGLVWQGLKGLYGERGQEG